VYQGIPATVLGLDLSHVDVETSVDAADATALPIWREAGLADGINVDSRQEALDTIQRIEDDLATAAQAGQDETPPGGQP
jgi:hypothetical protein